MKILVLMPCDEQHIYAASGIFKALPEELKECCFPMPMFMEYLVTTKVANDWIDALFYALLSAKKLTIAATQEAQDDAKDHLIIIGNVEKGCGEFDAVFSFQDIEETESYKDVFIEKLTDLVASEAPLVDQLKNLHTVDEVKLPLTNCVASADLISKYIKTGVKTKLNQLQKEYEEKIKEISVLKGVKLDVFPTSK